MGYAEIKTFPSHLLFDIARNEHAHEEARLAATEELIDRDDRRALHIDLAVLAAKVFAGRAERKPAEKAAVKRTEAPISTGPPSASVTTGSLLRDEIIIEADD